MQLRQSVALGPQFAKALALGNSPPRKPCRLRIFPADVDVNSVDLKRSRAVEREDTAIAGFHLRKKNPADGEAEKRNESSDEPGTANH